MWTENLETRVKVKELQNKVFDDQTVLKNKLDDGESQLNMRLEKIRELNDENMETIAKTV